MRVPCACPLLRYQVTVAGADRVGDSKRGVQLSGSLTSHVSAAVIGGDLNLYRTQGSDLRRGDRREQVRIAGGHCVAPDGLEEATQRRVRQIAGAVSRVAV